MSKRILSLVLALVMVLGTLSTMVFAETELDPKVQWLIDQDLIQGDGSGNYDLDKPVQRSVLARIVALGLEDEVAANALQAVPSGFADMTPAHWANGVAAYANAKGFMIGNEKNEFMPDMIVSYDQALVVLTKIALGGDLTPEEKAGSLTWYAPYVAKASELGLTEGVNITNVGAPAVKEDILIMLYNVLNNKDYGNYTVLKAIVLENDRVETLKENEIVVEVIKEIQRADFVTASRGDKDVRGEQYNFILSDKYDVEDLLGKVADFSIDKNGKVVEIKVDDSYQYLQGPVTAIEDALKVGTKEYTVVKEERVSSTDDRLYVVYQDNHPIAYRKFADARRYTDENGVGKLDFARVTVKNGKVLFVDGFNFTDIAPIKEVKEDEIVIYNDLRDGGAKSISEPSILIGYNDGKISRITLDDVKELNVIHTYDAGRSTAAIVRTDAEISGTYEKVSFDRDGKNAKVVVDDKEYSLVDANSKRPVYSYDSKDFYTLNPLNADRELREFKGENVVIALAVNNSVQYFASDIESGEFMALVSDVLARDVELVRANNDREEYNVTFKTSLSEGANNQQTRLGDFKYRDIVFASVDEKNLVVMNRFNDEDLTSTVVKEVSGKNAFDITRNYIETDARNYRILDRTNAFIAVGTTMRGIAIEDVVKNLKTPTALGQALTVKVISDAQFEEVATSSRLYTTGREDVAHTIVFTVNPLAVTFDDGIAIVERIYSAGRDYEVRLRYADDSTETLEVARPSQAYTAISNKQIKEDDVVELELTKADEPKVVSIASKIASDAPVFKVVATQSRGEYRILTIEDAKEDKEDYFIYRNADIFGEIDNGSKVSFTVAKVAGKLSDIDVLIVRKRTADVTGVHGSPNPVDPEEGTEAGVVTYVVDSTVYDNIFARFDLIDKNGDKVKLFVKEDFTGFKFSDGTDKLAVSQSAMLAWLASAPTDMPAAGDTITVEDGVLVIDVTDAAAERLAAIQEVVDAEAAKVKSSYDLPFGTAVEDVDAAVKALVEKDVNTTLVTVEYDGTNVVLTSKEDTTVNSGDIAVTSLILPAEDAEINPTTADFDLADKKDVTTTITWNDATEVTKVEVGGSELTEGAAYTVSGNTLTIKAAHFEGKVKDDIVAFTITFDEGNTATFTVTVINSAQ